MRKLVQVSLAAIVAVAALGTTSTAMARRGADDPVGHVRQCRGCDDAPGDVRQGRGADDPANHDANDDRVARSRNADDTTADRRGGADDPADHDVNDDRGGGADDPADHDANDDRGRGGHGADDPAGHD